LNEELDRDDVDSGDKSMSQNSDEVHEMEEFLRQEEEYGEEYDWEDDEGNSEREEANVTAQSRTIRVRKFSDLKEVKIITTAWTERDLKCTPITIRR
jgi:hypothetical protein